MKPVYIPRVVDDILKDRLDAIGAVLIAGPKWCGKTTTALQQAKRKGLRILPSRSLLFLCLLNPYYLICILLDLSTSAYVSGI